MAVHSRYNVSKDEEHPVLKNKLGITNQKMLDDTETVLLSDAYQAFFEMLKSEKITLNLDLIFKINSYFLGMLYSWAGKPRTVEMSKDGILFCASSQIKKELKILDQNIKDSLFEIQNDNKDKLGKKLAIIHCEFNAIHPFREGNGRTIRLFLDLITAFHGYKTIDYSKSTNKDYIKACIAGMHKDYTKMEKIIKKGLVK